MGASLANHSSGCRYCFLVNGWLESMIAGGPGHTTLQQARASLASVCRDEAATLGSPPVSCVPQPIYSTFNICGHIDQPPGPLCGSCSSKKALRKITVTTPPCHVTRDRDTPLARVTRARVVWRWSVTSIA